MASRGTRNRGLERLIAPLYRGLTGRQAGGGELLTDLLASYGTRDPRAIVEEHIRPFVALHEPALRGIFSAYEEDRRRPELFDGISALILFERLQNDRFRLQLYWPPELNIDVFDRMASIWGTPVTR